MFGRYLSFRMTDVDQKHSPKVSFCLVADRLAGLVQIKLRCADQSEKGVLEQTMLYTDKFKVSPLFGCLGKVLEVVSK